MVNLNDSLKDIVGVAGNAWHPMTDTLELKLQPLHFGRIVRGRLAPSTKTFLGDTTSDRDIDDFMTRRLTRRQINSKHMGVFDIKVLQSPLKVLQSPLKFVNTFIGKWRRSTPKTPDQEPPAFFNRFLSSQHNLMSTPQTAYTKFHAMPLSIQYEAHSS